MGSCLLISSGYLCWLYSFLPNLNFSYYKELIEQKCPTGPYRIAGFSFGSLVAMDIVLQLQAEGKKVAAVSNLF